MTLTRAQIDLLIDDKILTGGRRTLAAGVREVLKNISASDLNLIDDSSLLIDVSGLNDNYIPIKSGSSLINSKIHSNGSSIIIDSYDIPNQPTLATLAKDQYLYWAGFDTDNNVATAYIATDSINFNGGLLAVLDTAQNTRGIFGANGGYITGFFGVNTNGVPTSSLVVIGQGTTSSTHNGEFLNNIGDECLIIRDDRTADFYGQITFNEGVTGATPSPRIVLTDYFDNTGDASVSHLQLYTGFGFGISTQSLNYIVPNGNTHDFYIDSLSAVQFRITEGYNYTPNTVMIGSDSFNPANGKFFVYGGYSSFGGEATPTAIVYIRGEDNGTNYAYKAVSDNGTIILHSRNDGYNIMKANNAAIADGDLSNSSMSFYIDETGNFLIAKVKYAAGTVKTVSLPLI